LEGHPSAGAAPGRPRLSAEDHVDAVVFEDRTDRFGDVRILASHELPPELDHGHPAAEAAEGLREFHADIAAAEHDQVLGQPVEFECLYMGQGSSIGQARNAGNCRLRAEIEKDTLRLDPPHPARCQSDVNGPGANEAALPEEEFEPVGCKPLAMDLNQAVDHLLLTLAYTLHVRGH